jgi:hypothetical protein
MMTKRTTGRKLSELRQRVFAMYGDICWLCGGDGADTIDHIVKLMHGGDDDLDNLRPAHGKRSNQCVGNFSGLRPKSKEQGSQPIQLNKYELKTNEIKSVTDENGITWGDGWVEKTRGSTTSKMFYSVPGFTVNDPFIIDWLKF